MLVASVPVEENIQGKVEGREWMDIRVMVEGKQERIVAATCEKKGGKFSHVFVLGNAMVWSHWIPLGLVLVGYSSPL